MSTFNKFESFAEELATGQHDLSSDTLNIALTAAANPPLVTNQTTSDLTEINYANLSARTLQNVTGSTSSGVYILRADPLILNASGTVATFRYVILYNSTNNLLIGFADYGGNVDLLTGETFSIRSLSGSGGLITVQ